MSVSLTDLTTEQARAAFYAGAVVVVPIGATEQHGPHLPVETDYRMAQIIAEQSAAAAIDADITVLVTPPVWAGYSPHHMSFPGTVSVEFDTLVRLVTDIAKSLWAHGARKILFLNGHGGNANLLRGAVQRLRFEHGVRVAAANYWDFATTYLASWRQSQPGGIDHACEMETSLMLAARPDLVHANLVHDDTWFPHSSFLSGDLLIGAPVTVAWSFDELNKTGTLGNPAVASAERGTELMTHIVERVSAFLVEFHGWDWDSPATI